MCPLSRTPCLLGARTVHARVARIVPKAKPLGDKHLACPLLGTRPRVDHRWYGGPCARDLTPLANFSKILAQTLHAVLP
jgi:hypothetical protein